MEKLINSTLGFLTKGVCWDKETAYSAGWLRGIYSKESACVAPAAAAAALATLAIVVTYSAYRCISNRRLRNLNELAAAQEAARQQAAREQEALEQTAREQSAKEQAEAVEKALAEKAAEEARKAAELIRLEKERVEGLRTSLQVQSNQITETLNDLLITQWYLPLKKDTETLICAGKNDVASQELIPVFNDTINREISIVREMFRESAHNPETPPPNVILQGPPGTGKTMLIEHLCRNGDMGFIRIPSGAMESHIKIGTHIDALTKILNIAESASVPTCIIMDDGEELVAKRHEVAAPESKVTAYWLVEQQTMSEILNARRNALVNAILEKSGADKRSVSFSITTNRPQVIDKAFVTRARVLTIDPPGLEQRKGILIAHLPRVFNKNTDFLSFFNKGRLENMALKTEGFTGRNIVKMLEDLYASVKLQKGDIRQDLVDGSILATQRNIVREQD